MRRATESTVNSGRLLPVSDLEVIVYTSTVESTESGSSSASSSSHKLSYRQAYRPEWEQYDDLRGWLSRSRTKRGMAFCKLCNCNLEAKLSDLRKHKATNKHSDNAKLISQHRTLDSLAHVTQTLFAAVESAFTEDALPFDNLLGFASDGANAMLGRHNSVKTRLLAKQPNLFVMHCICHVAALCASHACSDAIPNDVEQLLQDTYNFFHQSSKRLAQLADFQHFVDVEPRRLLHPSQTRWLSLHQCVARMVEQWPALHSFFSSTDERLVIVQRTLERLDNPNLKLYFLFLSEVLPLSNRFNQLFQSVRPLLHVLHSELIVLYKKFLLKFIQEKVVEAHAHNILELDMEDESIQLSNDQLFIGTATRDFIESNDEIELHHLTPFFNNCRMYFVASVLEMRKRCPLDNRLLKLQIHANANSCNIRTCSKLLSNFPM